MTRIPERALRILIPFAALLASGCGGAGTTAVGDPPGGGIGGTGSVAVVAQGPITALGSVVVDGIEFETSASTRIIREGVEASEADLRVGMVVQVSGTFDPAAPPTALGYTPGVAEQVEYTGEVEGPVSVDPATGGISVLGRPVVISPATRLEGIASADGLADGDVIEVSGLAGPDGRILATYVELTCRAGECGPGDPAVDLRGPAEGLDLQAGRFRIHGQGVRFDDATEILVDLAEGAQVRVRGWLAPDGGVLAGLIEPGGTDLPEGLHAEVEGIVGTVWPADLRFTVAGIEVDAAGASFEGGTFGDLRPGLRVEVEGTVAAGRLAAREVEIKGGGMEEHDEIGTGDDRDMGPESGAEMESPEGPDGQGGDGMEPGMETGEPGETHSD